MFGLLTRRQVDAMLTEQAKADEKFRLQSFRQLEAMVEMYRREHINLSSALTSYSRTLSAQDDTVRLHLARIEFLQRSLTDATTTTESWAEDRKEALDRIAELEAEVIEKDKLARDWYDEQSRYEDKVGPVRNLVAVLQDSRRRVLERAAQLEMSARVSGGLYRSAEQDLKATESRERATLKALGESRARYGDLEARLSPADAENVGLVQARVRRLIEVLWASRHFHLGQRQALAEIALYWEQKARVGR